MQFGDRCYEFQALYKIILTLVYQLKVKMPYNLPHPTSAILQADRILVIEGSF